MTTKDHSWDMILCSKQLKRQGGGAEIYLISGATKRKKWGEALPKHGIARNTQKFESPTI